MCAFACFYFSFFCTHLGSLFSVVLVIFFCTVEFLDEDIVLCAKILKNFFYNISLESLRFIDSNLKSIYSEQNFDYYIQFNMYHFCLASKVICPSMRCFHAAQVYLCNEYKTNLSYISKSKPHCRSPEETNPLIRPPLRSSTSVLYRLP